MKPLLSIIGLAAIGLGATHTQAQQADVPAPVIAAPVIPALPSVPDRTFQDHGIAVLQGLDKVTARVSTFEAAIGSTANFGPLAVTPRACRKTPPVEAPEAAAFLEIVEQRPDIGSVPLFSGWMFASSPALSALEHPIYDVWVIDCR